MEKLINQYTWRNAFEAVAVWLKDYENRQGELIDLLRDIGIDNGLNDSDSTGKQLPLLVIDPFTFFSVFMKYGIKKRGILFSKLIKKAEINVEPPADFDGVPSAQAMKVWLFPSVDKRSPEMISTLWETFRCAQDRALDEGLFAKALAIPNTGYAKLTQCLFYTSPSHYFPIDAQTRPWLQKKGIDLPADESFGEYQRCLNDIEKAESKPFYELSYLAWKGNQEASVFTASQLGDQMVIEQPLNQILYGPPGTGKTYATTELAVQIADPVGYQALNDETDNSKKRAAIKQRYDELVEMKRIGFTTFHQSFSYEDFIEGIRATTDENTGALNYPVVDGIFKEMVINSSKSTGSGHNFGLSESPRVWKMSIDTRGPSLVRDHCFENGEARIGWYLTGDLGLVFDERDAQEQKYWDGLSVINQNTIAAFSDEIAVGDVLLCLKDKSRVQAVGVVTSDYFYDREQFESSADNFAHGRKVKWLHTGLDLNVLAINDNKRLVQKTVYQLDRISWDDVLGLLNESGYSLAVESGEKPNYVMIIDEINRGNIARIFGELITLLEPSKRNGAADSRKAILPYSKTAFSVPPNLYVIGTMNTADKSLAQLDLALRRRFSFIEQAPLPQLLEKVEVHGVNIGQLLDVINQRIEVLLDTDHVIGHSYFFGLIAIEGAKERETELGKIFSRNIIPLLKEYFFDDFERIAWVLNDSAKSSENRFIRKGKGKAIAELFGDALAEQLTDRRYHINEAAFSRSLAYQGVLGASSVAGDGLAS